MSKTNRTQTAGCQVFTKNISVEVLTQSDIEQKEETEFFFLYMSFFIEIVTMKRTLEVNVYARNSKRYYLIIIVPNRRPED